MTEMEEPKLEKFIEIFETLLDHIASNEIAEDALHLAFTAVKASLYYQRQGTQLPSSEIFKGISRSEEMRPWVAEFASRKLGHPSNPLEAYEVLAGSVRTNFFHDSGLAIAFGKALSFLPERIFLGLLENRRLLFILNLYPGASGYCQSFRADDFNPGDTIDLISLDLKEDRENFIKTALHEIAHYARQDQKGNSTAITLREIDHYSRNDQKARIPEWVSLRRQTLAEVSVEAIVSAWIRGEDPPLNLTPWDMKGEDDVNGN